MHWLRLSKYHDYEECVVCGSLFRRDKPDAEAIYGSGYWDRPGHSTLEEQEYNITGFRNDAGETKADAVLKHCREGFSCLEIGCAPGALLPLLRERFTLVIGIEYDAAYADRLLAIAGENQQIIFGAFPEVTARFADSEFDCIIALDLLEHVEDGAAFMAEVHRLLRPGGRAILMVPLLMEDGLDERFSLNEEHLAIYSERFIREWFPEAGFCDLTFDRWVVGHEVIVADKRRKV